jgi:hypothetical protein
MEEVRDSSFNVIWIAGDATVRETETGTSFKQALFFKEIGFSLHDPMIYHKGNPLPLNKNRYEPAFEYMFVFSKGKSSTFNPLAFPCNQAGLAPRQRVANLHIEQLEMWVRTRPKGCAPIPNVEPVFHLALQESTSF